MTAIKERSGARRGEGLYLAWKIGRSKHVREVIGLADDLKCSRAEAVGYLVMWEELILREGDALIGRVHGYRPKDLARELGWTRSPTILIRGLVEAGVLRTHRATFNHPYWLSTITGQHAREKIRQREDWARQKRQQRGSDVHPDSAGHGVDVHPDSTRTADIKKERKKGHPDPDSPPSPPPEAGGVGSARWKRMELLHPSPMNPAGCTPILAAMDDEKWALCLWVLENREKAGLSSLSRKKRAFTMNCYEFLRKAAYLQFSPEYRRNLAAPPPRSLAVETAELERERLEAKRRSLRELLEDPDCPEKEKERQRALYMRANPGDKLEWLSTTTTNTNGVTH